MDQASLGSLVQERDGIEFCLVEKDGSAIGAGVDGDLAAVAFNHRSFAVDTAHGANLAAFCGDATHAPGIAVIVVFDKRITVRMQSQ